METTHTIALDYLAGCVTADPQDLGTQLASYYGGQVVLARPKNGYTFGYGIEVGEEVMCEFHVRAGEVPWVFATGAKSQALHDFLTSDRLQFGWYVTRKDAALDVFDAEWFPLLVEAAKRYANAHGLTTGVAGDWMNPKRGRTFYLGSRSSAFFHRIYEKGRKERVDQNWIRCELEYKPQSREARFSATTLTAPQLWAMHAGPVFGETLGLDLAVVFAQQAHSGREKRNSDRARQSLAQQYGKTINQWVRDVGGDPVAFVAELLSAVEHQARVNKWEAAPPVSMPELEDPQ